MKSISYQLSSIIYSESLFHYFEICFNQKIKVLFLMRR